MNTLEENDTVIIKDYLSQKTYTYTLSKNGDIKKDYAENPIEFEEGRISKIALQQDPERVSIFLREKFAIGMTKVVAEELDL